MEGTPAAAFPGSSAAEPPTAKIAETSGNTGTAGPLAPSDSANAAAQATPQLTLIGAGHVFQIRNVIRDAIVALRPSVVFVELDPRRLQGLLERERTGHRPAPSGFVHRKLAAFQEGIAGAYGSTPGAEMLGAVDGARMVGARVACIDVDAEALLQRAVKELTWPERGRVVGMLVGNAFAGLRKKNRTSVEAELARYQADPIAVLGEMQQKFPTLHRVLIADRDAIMAQRIRDLLQSQTSGLAVLGDAHVNGMAPLLADLRPRIYRLEDVREGRLPKALSATGTTASVRFTVNVKSDGGLGNGGG